MKLCSPEYMQEVMVRSNADEKYRALAKGQNETYTMILEPEPAKGVAQASIAGFEAKDGQIVTVWSGTKPSTFTLSAPYGTWVDILRGKLGATTAITMRKLKVQGPFLQLLKGADRTLRWVDILRTIPTEFEGQYAEYAIKGT